MTKKNLTVIFILLFGISIAAYFGYKTYARKINPEQKKQQTIIKPKEKKLYG
ncbi:MAG: hypothetical protein GXO50_08340, partial [Chlorobi bacterium]|nr:hypothetical protein [Chlorobiota bacterium]